MQSTVGKQKEKGCLCPAVALTKRVYRVECRQKMRCTSCKLIGRKSLEIVLTLKVVEECLHLLLNIFGIAKSTSAFADANCADFSRPLVYVLKEVTMDGVVISNVEVPLDRKS